MLEKYTEFAVCKYATEFRFSPQILRIKSLKMLFLAAESSLNLLQKTKVLTNDESRNCSEL